MGMQIVHVPDEGLNKKVKAVKLRDGKPDRRTQKIITQMIETLEGAHDPEGVGLAANQVGLPLAIFIMKPTAIDPAKVCINPKVLKVEGKPSVPTKNGSEDNDEALEGCLSIPRIWGPVRRAKRIYLEYTTEEGERKAEWFDDFEAIIVQHEMDHLNGVLFTQRVLEQKGRLLRETGTGEYKPYEI